MKLYLFAQRSEAWRQARCGRLTGSRAKDMLATIKSGEAAARRDLRMQLIAERLTGVPQESGYVNADMQWGVDHEAEAITAYEAETGVLVTPIGFCEHDAVMAGTSPDGFVGRDGLLSVKCPRTANHLRYIRDGVEPSEHAAQNTHELWLTGRAWLDFVSYDPRLPDRLQLLTIRVTRTPDQLADYEKKVVAFLREVETELNAIRTLMDLPKVLKEAVA
jgi:hypothetical protein